MKILDLGVGFDADSLWFNLKPGGLGRGDPRARLAAERSAAPRDLAGCRSAAVRQCRLPRRRRADLRPGHRGQLKWYADLPPVPHDPARARQELAAVGLVDRNGDGTLEDAANRPARFALITQKGNSTLERGAAEIRDGLKKIGSSSTWWRSTATR